MPVPSMSYSTLVSQYLTPNGWTVQTPQPQDFFDGHNRIYISKGDYSFPLQYQNHYLYLQIIHLFRDLEIPAPKNFMDYYEKMRAAEVKRKKSFYEDLTEKPPDKPDETEQSSK
jgi:hypothetical protein